MRHVLAVALIALLAPVLAPAQESPLWGDLEPGPYAVGFRVHEVVDPSRGYRPPVDWLGRPVGGETARPVHVRLWYPAVRTDGTRPILFGEYLELVPDPLSPATGPDPDGAVESAIREFFGGPIRRWYPDGATPENRREVLGTRTAAHRDAPFATGPFPVVVHGGFALEGQSVLLEYLASHGYVVAAFPPLGTGPHAFHRGEGTPEWHEDVAEDFGFVHGFLRRIPEADPGRAAAIGMFAGPALLYQMREMRLAAIAALEGSYPDELRAVPGYGTEKVRIPILHMPATGREHGSGIFDSLRYAPRTVVEFADVPHVAFYQFDRVARPDSARGNLDYEAIARITRAFLDVALKDDTAGDTILDRPAEETGFPAGYFAIREIPARPAPPTESEFLTLIRERRTEEARAAFDASLEREPAHRIFGEGPMRDTALFLRRDHGSEVALPAFQMLVEAYPDSPSGHDLLSETLADAGRDAGAREHARRALRLLDDAPTPPARAERIRRRATERLERLTGRER